MQGFKLCLVGNMTVCLLRTGVSTWTSTYIERALKVLQPDTWTKGDTYVYRVKECLSQGLFKQCVNNIWAHSRHSVKRSWAAEFSVLNCCSSKYYTLATMTARMPLKGGEVNFCSHLVPQVFIPYCASFMNQVTFKSSVAGLSLFSFTMVKGNKWRWNTSDSIQPCVCQLHMCKSTESRGRSRCSPPPWESPLCIHN